METLRSCADRLTALPFVNAVDILGDDDGALDCRVVVHTPRGDYQLAAEVQRTALSYALVDRSLSAVAGRGSAMAPWILFAPYVSSGMGTYLAERGVNFIDAVGNCRIQLDDAYVAQVEGRKPPRRPVLQEGIRAPGYQVLFALLARSALLGGTVREIAAAAGVGKTTAAKMIRRLREEQLITPADHGHRLLRPDKLVDRWLIAYQDIVRPHLFAGSYRTADADPAALVNRIEGILEEQGIAGVWSGGAALDRITGWYRGRSTVLHLPEIPSGIAPLLRALPAREGDLTVLRLPGPVAAAGIAFRTAHPLLVYTELATRGGERAREMAQQFWAEYLER